MEWQPIETAPREPVQESGHNKYAEYILVWHPHYASPLRAQWWFRSDSDACNFIADGGFATFPTHWMPLPEPPK